MTAGMDSVRSRFSYYCAVQIEDYSRAKGSISDLSRSIQKFGAKKGDRLSCSAGT